MTIVGFQKTTLLDFPGQVACSIFLNRCNFKCPYCHNWESIVHSCEPVLSSNDLLAFLTKRRNVLKGVCITGGEPTLHLELPSLIRQIKDLGYLVKLDTNGSNPQMLKDLYEENLLDYVAMDIKSSLSNYGQAANIPINKGFLDKIKESVEIIRFSDRLYEFRTTVCKELHSKETFLEIGAWLKGSKTYVLQNVQQPINHVAESPHSTLTPFTQEELASYAFLLEPYFETVSVR